MERLIHGSDYNPEQWLNRPDILEEDIRLMKEAKINEVTLGVFSWSILEPEEGEYHLDWLEKIMDTLYENGICVILATPSGARPVWLDEKYPEVLRVNADKSRNDHGVRHNHCMSSMAYREKVRLIDRQLALRFGKHPGLLMWHISNEVGGACFCPNCQKRFQEYLREHFHNDIEELNEAWWTTFWSHRYQRFDQVLPPFAHGETSIMGLNLEWKRFTTWNMTDYLKSEIEVLREITPEIPITTNFMKLYKGLDYRVIAKELDVISWDSYPRYHNDYESLYETAMENSFDHAVMRGMKRDTPFLLMESVPGAVNWHAFNKLKRPKMNQLAAMQAIACGSDSVQYFQWRKSRGSYEQYHGAVIDHLGRSDTRIFQEVKATGEMIQELDKIAGSVILANVAILFDWDNRWAIDDMAGLSQEKKQYENTCMEQYKILQRLGVEVDIISREDSLDRYSFVIAPMLYLLGKDTAKKLEEYVEAGGVLLATYLTGYVDEHTLCYLGGFPGDGLTKLFGLYAEEIDTLYPSDKNSAVFEDGISYQIRDFAEILKVQDAEVLAVYKEDFYEGTPVVAKKKFGEGQAWYVAARMEADGMEYIYQKCLDEAGIVGKEIPQDVEYHVRQKGDETYEFYLNYSDLGVRIEEK